MERPGPPGPERPDLGATQPMPRARPAASGAESSRVDAPVGAGGANAGTSAPPPAPASATAPRKRDRVFTPRYGNVGAYLLARLAAFAVDLFGVAFVAATFVYAPFHDDPRTLASVGHPAFASITLASLGGAYAFTILCEGILGTTLGKALFGLHVFRARGGYAGLGRALIRGFVRPLDLLVVGPLVAAVTPKHQRLGDLAAGTTVVRSPLGLFAPLLAVLLIGGVAYAQVAYGGGVDSALAVSAETANDAPAWERNVAGVVRFASTLFIGGATAGGAAPGSPEATATPNEPVGLPTDAPTDGSASDEPGGAPPSAPSTAISAAPAGGSAPASTDAAAPATDAASEATFPPGGEAPAAPPPAQDATPHPEATGGTPPV